MADAAGSSSPRLIAVDGQQRSAPGGPSKYVGNRIKTSKYTKLNFVPVNLWEQLHKFGNVYFLLISVLMYLGEHTSLYIGTIKAFSTFATLLAMMSVTAVVALLDDNRRHTADLQTNGQEARLVQRGSRKPASRKWEDVQVGDVLLVKDGEEFPADLVPFFCSGDEGACYVSTANLDGETNLKLKGAPAESMKAFAGISKEDARSKEDFQEQVTQAASSLEVEVEAEAPQVSIHDFKGRMRMLTGSKKDEALGAKHLLLRGTVLRNTAFCIGVVVYTGKETRMVMNSRPAPLKQSTLEVITNNLMLLVLLAQAALALVSDFTYISSKSLYSKAWYLSTPDLVLPDGVGYWLTFFVLYSNMMPISLYPTMEWCNYWQTYFIKNDKNMYYEEMDMPAGVRSSNLCQELGQVGYIFSDKTGTLTQNVMELKRVFIGGQIFGEMTPEKGFNDHGDMSKVRSDRVMAQKIDDFLEVLAVSHTVMVSEETTGELKYEAESPDESALVEATASLGWRFQERVRNQMMVKFSLDGKSEVRKYIVHAVNAFDSTRKRMSVVVEHEGKYVLMVKGADNVMLALSDNKDAALDSALGQFARQGLRTLVIGRRELSKSDFEAWLKDYDAASRSLGDREGDLAKVADKVEQRIAIAGVTAIEDKLQVGVPETITMIRQAGVNLWVLTGDKLETARNIGFSSNVLDDKMEIAVIDKPSNAGSGDLLARLRAEVETSSSKLLARSELSDRAMMVTGPALDSIFEEESLKLRFLDVATSCSIVIACRVSPLQKAQMVRLVREGAKPSPVTLAVGDGANDVPMIQEAQVGVGIAGKEGRQAMNNSDFSIGQFAYLQRLLLVHGRWNYRRACKFTLFTFWRNAVQVLCIFYFTFVSGFSGTCLFEDWIRLSFNFLCSFPIMATGCFDQDVPADVALQHPKLYEFGRLGVDLNPQSMLGTMLSAFLHSVILMVMSGLAFESMDILNAGDYYTFGTAVYTFLLVDMNYRVAFLNHTHNKYTLGAIIFSFVCYCIFLVLYPCSQLATSLLAPNMYMVPVKLVQTVPFWLCLVAVPAFAMTIDIIALSLSRWFDHLQSSVADLRNEGQADSARRSQSKSIDLQEFHSHLPKFSMLEDCLIDTEMHRRSSTDVENTGKEAKYKDIDLSAFGQQATRGLKFHSSLRCVRIATFVTGVLLLVLGCIVLQSSFQTAQMRIHYEGERHNDPWGTKSDDIHQVQQKCEGKSKCTIHIEVTKDMRQPILMYYAVGPFFQNYNDYKASEVPLELMGKSVSEAQREKACPKSTRERDGKEIVPCGMKAMSMFNDTFELEDGLEIDYSGVAWSFDVDRYSNPSDYLKRPNTLWLKDIYPDIVTEEEGVRNERFVEWMRPSALPNIHKRYGWLKSDLKAGQKIKVTIKNNFPVTGFGGSKHLVFTEYSPALGARHNGLGYALLCGGLISMLAMIVSFLYSFFNPNGNTSSRKPGHSMELTPLQPRTMAQNH